MRRDDRPRRPWRLRWSVDGKVFERRFATKALADSERASLLRAAREGQPFDEASGLPVAQVAPRVRTTWHEHACAYAAMKWPSAAAKSRKSIAEALTTVSVALVHGGSPYSDAAELRRALLWSYIANSRKGEPPAELAKALAWLQRRSLPISRVAEPAVVRAALDACSRRLDGSPAAATTARRKRAVFHNALGYAVELGLLDSNPIGKVQWKAAVVAERVDRRVVASTAQVERLLDVLPVAHHRGGHYVAFFGCLYYAGMRPSEAASVRADDCRLPPAGWGRIILVETAPHAGEDWTDDGDVRDVGGLKHRAQGEVRQVPIPPELVALLRQHLKEWGTAADGRLFRAARGGYVPSAEYAKIWKLAREAALTPAQVASPLVARPYDLRHAAVTLWLNAGVPAPEIAARVGHGVDVLLRVYAGCIDGQETVVNARIEAALRTSRAPAPNDGQAA